MNQLESVLLLGAFLFSIGLAVVVARQNLIMMLLGLELMLNGANVNLVAFNAVHASQNDGKMFVLFVVLVAVCEAAVGIAIVLRVYRFYQTSLPGKISELKEK